VTAYYGRPPWPEWTSAKRDALKTKQDIAIADCEAHAVDWRAEALAMRPVVEAAASRVDKHRAYEAVGQVYKKRGAAVSGDLITASKVLTEADMAQRAAVDTYRTRKP
jgi:hypothetical protein